MGFDVGLVEIEPLMLGGIIISYTSRVSEAIAGLAVFVFKASFLRNGFSPVMTVEASFRRCLGTFDGEALVSGAAGWMGAIGAEVGGTAVHSAAIRWISRAILIQSAHGRLSCTFKLCSVPRMAGKRLISAARKI